MPNFTYEPGREIYLDGKPLIDVGRLGDTKPVAADNLAKLIVRLLNEYCWHHGTVHAEAGREESDGD